VETTNYLRPDVVMEIVGKLQTRARIYRQKALEQSVPEWRQNYMRMAAEADCQAADWRKHLPIVPCAAPPVLNERDAKRAFAMPHFTRLPLQLPTGQTLAPDCCWYEASTNEFWYFFRVDPCAPMVAYAETTLQMFNYE
jgi:hypothetical protein